MEEDPFNSQDFYELMQQYRWAKPFPQDVVCDAFEAVKAFCRRAVRAEVDRLAEEPTPSADAAR